PGEPTMPGLTPDQINDFTTTTFNVLAKKDSWKDISTSLQHYIVTENFLSDGKMSTKGGAFIQETLQLRNTGTYEHSGWFAPTSTTIVDLAASVQVPWAMARVSMAYSIYEDVWQEGPQRILRYLAMRKHSMNTDLVEG